MQQVRNDKKIRLLEEATTEHFCGTEVEEQLKKERKFKRLKMYENCSKLNFL